MSQPVKTMSFKSARGTKSLISGELLSVRLPRRMVPIWVSEPMGLARPRRTASTPAIIVVATAPRPTTITPSLPLAGSTFVAAVFWPPCLLSVAIPLLPNLPLIRLRSVKNLELSQTQQCTLRKLANLPGSSVVTLRCFVVSD